MLEKMLEREDGSRKKISGTGGENARHAPPELRRWPADDGIFPFFCGREIAKVPDADYISELDEKKYGSSIWL